MNINRGESSCCGAPSIGPVDDEGCGMCSDCKEYATFDSEEDDK